ncbi:hypothetical protein BA893_19230 [Vibrio natriegens]|nr:hypothetical protein BA893_19230 [Vibrio natriegens]
MFINLSFLFELNQIKAIYIRKKLGSLLFFAQEKVLLVENNFVFYSKSGAIRYSAPRTMLVQIEFYNVLV